jgi:glycosyltransferase involved in cell wall biosynthesis
MNLTIGFPHKPIPKGGPGVFQSRFEEYIRAMGWQVVYPEDNVVPDAVIVVGGTKKIGWLLKLKFKNVPVIYRLDGMNWLHRETSSTISKWILFEVRNIIMNTIRSVLATYIVYQSMFVKKWWGEKGWISTQKNTIVYNGVDLDKFQPRSEGNKELSILCIEGNIDYTPFAVELLNAIQEKLINESDFKSLVVYGSFEYAHNQKGLSSQIDYRGKIANEKIFEVYKNAVYLSLDINAACPNTVIEALASGIPVIGFDSGALKELVEGSFVSGKVVEYGGDPWKIDFPNVDALIIAAKEIKANWETYSANARKNAIERFSISYVVENYIKVIKELVNPCKNI